MERTDTEKYNQSGNENYNNDDDDSMTQSDGTHLFSIVNILMPV